jgi:hypothetical protein
MEHFCDSQAMEKPSINRIFCGDCFRPEKMQDDDLEEDLAASDFCRCGRRAKDA